MDNTQTNIVPIEKQDPFFTQCKDGDPNMSLSGNNGIAYFLAVFMNDFENGTNQLQYGETNLTEAMQNITKNIDDAKTKQLQKDNDVIQEKIKACHSGDKNYDDEQAAVTAAEQTYKLDDTKYQSQLQAMSPITTTDSDLTTSISQNNNTINQMAASIIGILKMVAEQLIRS